MIDFRNVVVIGSGVLGSQIAFQTAYSGIRVTVNDISETALEKAKNSMKTLTKSYARDLHVTPEKLEQTLSLISYSSDLKDSVKDADLVIEAVPEVKEIKINLYQQLAQYAPANTVFATNSSTFVPSEFAEYTGRPDKFLALHFANQIWLNNTAEIQGSPQTDPQVFDSVVAFAKKIGMIPLTLKKEQHGYILNSLLIPFLHAAEELMVGDIADPHIIDKTWMVATKAPRGPFAILDIVGLNTAYNIAMNEESDSSKKIAKYLKDNYIDKGKLGLQSGEGFYKYPNPAYLNADFLK